MNQGRIVNDFRIKQSLATIQLLLKNKNKLILMSHLGRPKEGKYDKNNSLEPIALSKHKKLKTIKIFLENLLDTVFVRMTGSGSALVAYFHSKVRCDNAKKLFNKRFKNYWCISSKTI